MSENSTNLAIDENELEPSDQIALYTEFIRILEKDIDDARSNNSREGWTSWGIAGAIVTAIFVLLGQTRELQGIPPETVKTTIVFVLSFQFLFGFYNLLTNGWNFVKEGRLIDSEKVFEGRRFLFFLRGLILAIISILIYLADYTNWVKLVSISSILILIIYILLSLGFFKFTKNPLGNNPNNQKVSSASAYILIVLNLIPLIMLGYQLTFPIGQSLTATYTIAICISGTIVLLEILFANALKTDNVREFQDLKDDIIFRRVNLNEALYRYKILIEGKSLFDQMKPDFDRMMSYLHRQSDIYEEQKKIVKKITELIPQSDKGEIITKDKDDQINIFLKSLETYTRELNGLSSLVNTEFNPFYLKLKKSTDACGDYETDGIIKNLINQKMQQLVQQEKELNDEREFLKKRLETSNSDSELK